MSTTFNFTERRKRIYSEYKKCIPIKEIGRDFNISRQRVSQIVQAIKTNIPKEELEKLA